VTGDHHATDATAGHGCAHSHAGLRQASGRALWSALVILAVFFVVELVGGILTNSLALISDAAHLLTDVAAIALALTAQWFARKSASARRSFGYRRVEIIAAQANGFTLILVAVYIFVEAWRRVHDPPQVLGLPMLVVAAVGLVAQLAATLVLRRACAESLNVRGAYVHALTDAIQSVGVLGAGAIILATGRNVVDPIISALIGIMVAWSGGKILAEATHVLIEGTPRELDLGRVAQLIESTPGVLRVGDLHVWALTSGYNVLSAHVAATPTAEDAGHELLRRELTARLCASFPIQHLTLQIERECELCRSSACCSWLSSAPPP
jgi:cobalt-zinc-cadmium efflux system protein